MGDTRWMCTHCVTVARRRSATVTHLSQTRVAKLLRSVTALSRDGAVRSPHAPTRDAPSARTASDLAAEHLERARLRDRRAQLPDALRRARPRRGGRPLPRLLRGQDARARAARGPDGPLDAIGPAQAPPAAADGGAVARRATPGATGRARPTSASTPSGITVDRERAAARARARRGRVLMRRGAVSRRARAAGRRSTRTTAGAAARSPCSRSPRGARASSSRRCVSKSQPGWRSAARRM